MLSSSLTREVDLTGVDAAALEFRTWRDIESHFDYGYVAASTDGGRTWETLPGTTSTADDPNQANYGHGYTDKSVEWTREEVDLSAYAGQRVLLRFWYITDPGLNLAGWLIDDISIPAIGLSDDAEDEDHGWTVDGFVRSSNRVPQEYIVQLVEYGPETTVRRIELDENNRAAFELGQGTRRAVLIVSGATRWTSETAPYRVVVE
jgi:bacillopeptidase F (M6 metalloprotease family)